MRFKTLSIHAGQGPDPTYGAVMTPIYQTSTFAFRGVEEPGPFDYSRSGNPTRKAFERALADLEGGTGGLAFSSGMAATTCAMMLLSSGDHVVAGSDIYGGTYRLLHNVLDRFGIEVTLVGTTGEPGDFEAAITPQTKMLWIESPGNPLMTITDIAACAEIATRRGILLGVDNTFATPALTRPLELGADLVMHSATKYLNGHSDVIAGALVSARADDLWARITARRHDAGAILGPFEAWLLLRGLRTLFLRVERACASAQFLAERPAVVNGHLVDLSKRAVSRNLVRPGDAWPGPVIVKSDLNHGGVPERRAFGRERRYPITNGWR